MSSNQAFSPDTGLTPCSGHEGAALQRRVVGDLEDALAGRRFENDVRVIWAAQDDAYCRHARLLNPRRRRFRDVPSGFPR